MSLRLPTLCFCAAATLVGPRTLLAAPPSASPTSEPAAVEAGAAQSRARSGDAKSDAPVRAWLRRPLPPSARFLDHGVLALAAAGGAPHLYRLELSLGLLDHLSVGVTARWLPEEARPRWSPKVALAVYRARWWEVGFRYAQVLHRAPPVDEDPSTPDFDPRSHYTFATAAFAQQGFSVGVDVGSVYTRDLPLDPNAAAGSYRNRWLPAGGLFLRYGTRRWGLTLQGQMPVYTVELAVDLRFGLFEVRPRGRWRPSR